jgi:thiosulfate dehydrogenase (quinone) large subunit
MVAPRTLTPAAALFPLRLFLGGTFVYAGIQKLSDPGFLNPDAPTYIGTQLEGFADGTPGSFLLGPALSHVAVAGVGVALLEIMIGALVLMGVLTRPAAAAGLALNLVLFLTATWHSTPYFLGSDIVFVFAWLPFVLAGADGQPTVHALLARRPLRIGRAVRPEPVLSRRAVLTRALGLAGLLTAVTAAASALARGTYEPPPRPRLSTRRSDARADASPGEADLGRANALAPGDSLAYTDPGSGQEAILVRRPDGKLYALSALCTHAGCNIEFSRDTLKCPCHNSTFDIRTGAPERGPARKPLATAEVEERAGRILARPLGRA